MVFLSIHSSMFYEIIFPGYIILLPLILVKSLVTHTLIFRRLPKLFLNCKWRRNSKRKFIWCMGLQEIWDSIAMSAFDALTYASYMAYIERHSSQFTSFLTSYSIIAPYHLIFSFSSVCHFLCLLPWLLSLFSCRLFFCQITLMSIIGSSKSLLSGLLSSQ